MIRLYGISNCDTVRKARGWLDARQIAHAFHDYRKEGVDGAQLERWAEALGWETLLNRSGTTFRKLAEADKADLTREKALALMAAQPSLIRRPVVEHEAGVLAGFRPEQWEQRLAAAAPR